ncbi:hypothetical protein BS50DRAFT_166335 [Corynespora cassiicola Philippines]|uniref:Uncharacterized protein n=1 Tax=Corynespora cassiicola Philippines TaxID=1448308 RepID=A0A2T2P4U1_CORCC|nr:hypothetical protein BS50DRAFT_166335 [Corynespora cassiicola Philippines]
MNHVATLLGAYSNSADNANPEDGSKRPRQVAEQEYTAQSKRARREAGYEKQRLQYTPKKRSLPASLHKHVSAHIKIREVCGIDGCIYTPSTYVQLKQHRATFYSTVEKKATGTKPTFACNQCDVICSNS